MLQTDASFAKMSSVKVNLTSPKKEERDTIGTLCITNCAAAAACYNTSLSRKALSSWDSLKIKCLRDSCAGTAPGI